MENIDKNQEIIDRNVSETEKEIEKEIALIMKVPLNQMRLDQRRFLQARQEYLNTEQRNKVKGILKADLSHEAQQDIPGVSHLLSEDANQQEKADEQKLTSDLVAQAKDLGIPSAKLEGKTNDELKELIDKELANK